MYRLSKSVQQGMLVTLRGDKFIVCSGRAKPAGVYCRGIERTILTLNGQKSEYTMPSGIVVKGDALVIAEKSAKEVYINVSRLADNRTS